MIVQYYLKLLFVICELTYKKNYFCSNVFKDNVSGNIILDENFLIRSSYDQWYLIKASLRQDSTLST